LVRAAGFRERHESRPLSLLSISRLLTNSERNGEEEPRSSSFLTLHPKSASMRLHDGFAERETEPGPAAAFRVRPPERDEQLALLLWWNAGTIVGDHESRGMIVLLCCDRHVSARRRELDRVSEQVAEHLEDTLAVRRNGRKARRS